MAKKKGTRKIKVHDLKPSKNPKGGVPPGPNSKPNILSGPNVPFVMGGGEIAKDAIRILTTAGLSKDVIDLLKEKVALLTEQITALETENSNLKKKVADLEQQLTSVRPKGDLHPDAVRFLKVLFRQGAQPVSQISALIGIEKGFGEYHRDELLKREMIGYPMVRRHGQEPSLLLKPKGRAYLVVNEHV